MAARARQPRPDGPTNFEDPCDTMAHDMSGFTDRRIDVDGVVPGKCPMARPLL